MTTVRYMVGDVFDRMAELEDNSVDLILTSPPFLALRSYLPADHPDKSKEIGSEATPAEFVDVLLRLSAEWRRLLTPHGSLCVELGDTYSGSGGAGGDDLIPGHLGFERYGNEGRYAKDHQSPSDRMKTNPGWPLAKSLTLTPEAYRFALAYGINPHTGTPSPAGQWRIRNVIRWVRPNPPVGALGDKFRPATSELVVACTSKDRWFDLDAVREIKPWTDETRQVTAKNAEPGRGGTDFDKAGSTIIQNPAGAPPLDWWKISPKGYAGAHYAVWPSELCVKPIQAMCPREVCRECGEPRRRVLADTSRFDRLQPKLADHIQSQRLSLGVSKQEVDGWFGFNGMVQHWESATVQPAIPTGHVWAELKERLQLSDEFDDLVLGERSWTESTVDYLNDVGASVTDRRSDYDRGGTGIKLGNSTKATRNAPDEWSDCGHDNFRNGLVLDPFAGTGTTLAVAHGHGRDAIGIDIDERSAELARDRVGPLFLEIDYKTEGAAATYGE